MRGRDHYQPSIIKPPIIPCEDTNSTLVGQKPKENSPKIIFYGCYFLDDHILPDWKQFITDPDTIVRKYEALDADSKPSVPVKYYLAAKTLVKWTP